MCDAVDALPRIENLLNSLVPRSVVDGHFYPVAVRGDEVTLLQRGEILLEDFPYGPLIEFLWGLQDEYGTDWLSLAELSQFIRVIRELQLQPSAPESPAGAWRTPRLLLQH